MGLKTIYADAAEIPADQKAFYVEDGDKFVLDLEDVDNHPKVRGVITANRENVRKRDALKSQVEELQAKVSGLPEDFDPDEWTRLKSGKSGDAALEQLKEQHGRALAATKTQLEQQIAALTAQIGERDGYIDNTLRDGGLKDSLMKVGINPDLLDGALGVLRNKVKVAREDNGQRRAFVETDLGEVDVPAFVSEWAKTAGKAYLAPLVGPGGTGGGRPGGGKTMTRAQFDALPAAEKAVAASKVQIVD